MIDQSTSRPTDLALDRFSEGPVLRIGFNDMIKGRYRCTESEPKGYFMQINFMLNQAEDQQPFTQVCILNIHRYF